MKAKRIYRFALFVVGFTCGFQDPRVAHYPALAIILGLLCGLGLLSIAEGAYAH